MSVQSLYRLYRWLFAHSAMRRWNLFVFNLSLRGLGVLNYENMRASGERHLLESRLPRVLPEVPTVFDVGAFTGQYSEMVLKVFPRARIYAFEPHPENFARFRALEGDIELHRLALGEQSGFLKLYDRGDVGASSHTTSYPEVITGLHKQPAWPLTVPVSTIDEVCSDKQIDYVDLLKIDVEGHELAVLNGADGMISRDAVGVVQFEFNEMNVMSRTFVRDFRYRLPRHKLMRLLPRGMIPVDDRPLRSELFAFQNIVAIPVSSSYGQDRGKEPPPVVMPEEPKNG